MAFGRRMFESSGNSEGHEDRTEGKMTQHTEMSNDIDDVILPGFPDVDDSLQPEERAQGAESVATSESDKALKYCIAASVALHLVFLLGLPRFAALTPTRVLPNPAEQVTRVRLVEPPNTEKKPEPPPQYAEAISDRDHTAERRRLPKMPPSANPPLGKIEAPRDKLAALIPPRAPEELEKEPEKEEKTEKEEAPPKPEPTPQPAKKQRPKAVTPQETQRKKPDKPRTTVDLTPTPGDIAKGLSALRRPSELYPDGEVDEAVVDINTREERFFSYLLHLKTKIQSVWVYPTPAARAGIGGSLTVEFSVQRDGQLLEVNLLDSSGHTILDESAMRAIRTAAPFFKFPDRMNAKRLRIRAHFVYVTSNVLRRMM